MTALGTIIEFFQERFPIDKMNFQSMVAKQVVPVHSMSWSYYLGGLTLFFLLIQGVTGVLMIFYYEPTVVDAYSSVQYLVNYVSGGELIHNMHSWSASCTIFFAFAHLLTAFAMKSFEKPREITWISGVLMLFILLAAGFTGTLLPWNQLAVNATKVGLQSVEAIGNYLPFGIAQGAKIFKVAFQGETALGQSTLSRFFAVHVMLLPSLLLLLGSLHLVCVQLLGISKGTDQTPKKTAKLFLPFLCHAIGLCSCAFLTLFILSTTIPFDSFMPYPLLEPYNMLGATPGGIKPQWYFYFVYYPVTLMPLWVVLLVSLIATTVLLLTPWIFKSTSRRVLQAMALTATVYFVVMTVFGGHICHMIKPGA
jgi:cytochrome b6